MKRSYLFLQGVCSPFFRQLADQLVADGHEVLRVNFNMGDVANWGRRPSVPFRGRLDELPEFLRRLKGRHGITDQVLFGDCRPVHAPALDEKRGIRTHVFEEGYFRPYWITLERGGVNAHSPLPRKPEWYRQVGALLTDHGDGNPFKNPFVTRAAHDVAYHAAGFWNPLLFPGYRTHAQVNAAHEYYVYLRRMARVRRRKVQDDGIVRDLAQMKQPYFLLPLQLDSDAQILRHSSFKNMTELMTHVLTSFAAHAPKEAVMVVKNHPLDIGLIRYDRIVTQLTNRLDLHGRVFFLESGDLNPLLRHAQGMVTVNSTVGGLALGMGCPAHALSDPIYKMQGLTDVRPLDQFWQSPQKPDPELFRCFRNTVIHAAQINGGFYSKEGIVMAVANCRASLQEEMSPLEALLK